MLSNKQKFYESADLVERLCSAATENNRAVIFLVGSPISTPDHVGGYGVPGVSGMVELIRRELKSSDSESTFEQSLSGQSADRYRKAFEFLHGRRGQDVVNRIVRTAVWQTLQLTNVPEFLRSASPENADANICKALEREVGAWFLPRAVDTFGSLLVDFSDTFGSAVLTTNFDPLIEVSILKQGGQCYRTVLHDDGKLGQTVAEGTHIVHLHGYWHGYDTLHTPQQLVQPRPQLGRSLARVVEASTLVVLGYSGWDDVITQTLVELLSDSGSNPEVLWSFHDNDVAAIQASNERVLRVLGPGIGRGRVSLYRGIDCYSVFSEIRNQLSPSYPSATGPTRGPQISTTVKEDSADGTGPRRVRIEIDFAMPAQASADSDSPLFVTTWVGRNQELSILASLSTPVAFITGLGGQGKSALAGRFLGEQISEGSRFDTWDWRDCREESDRLSTQILRLVEHLTNGALDASRIEVSDIRAVVGVLFNVLKDRKALLVFDNVDQYVDLETFAPVKGLDVLVSEAQARSHKCLFLFTCRPDVRVDESRAMRIPLSGLTVDETRELITACGVPAKNHDLARELHQTTDGHPLWVNLVAMQALRHRDGLRGALELIRQGGATLPDTTRTIWRILNDQQRDVLRTMAELDRPEPESHLLDLLPGVNANRVNRALKTLRSFHLIEIRTRSEGEPLLGLHPIIREFVRTNFARRDRERYVGAILGYLDRMIHRFKNLLPQDPSYEILEHWTRKADLQISFRRFEEATSTIAEIGRPLINRGYSEEMIRLTLRLVNALDWAEACSSFKRFDTVFGQCVTQMIESGHDSTEELLNRYEDSIPGMSSQFILLCNLRCYADWFVQKFDSAIQWGERGKQLKERTSVDTGYSTTHHLALSRRDAGDLSEAIESFLEGESLESVVTPGERIDGKESPFYGNIGRCLFMDNQLDEALSCYVKSAQLLEESRDHQDRLNKGYIRLWIADLLVRKRKYELAATLYRAAVCMWDDSSPPRSALAKQKLEILVAENDGLETYLEELDWKVEGEYGRWLECQ